MDNVIRIHRIGCCPSRWRQASGWSRVSRISLRNSSRRVDERPDDGSLNACAGVRDIRVYAENAGPPWDAKMFRQCVFESGEPGTEWAAINHFSDNDLEIDEKSKALQQSITRFEQTYYMISIAYWSVWLASLLSGNALLTKISSFSVFCWAMLAASFSFSAYFMARMIKAVGRPHDLLTAIQSDMSGLNRYSWRTLFWLGFALFYVAPTSTFVAKYFGSFGTVMCFYGLILVASSALLIKTWTFMGDPNIPMRLISVGPYSLLRHPQALGNLLFVCGFALTGGSLWSAAAFLASGILYARNIVPLEEQMLTEAFPNSYTHYCERVPRFSGALLLLLVVQTAMMIRYGVGGGAY